MLQCKLTKLLKNLSYFQLLVKPDQSNKVYHLSMINQTLCIV